MAKFHVAALTRSVEDYLKAIYQLTEDDTPASTTALADTLAVAAPSVTGMVKRLAEAGLLEHVPYKGVTLTDDGRRAALRMLRRHRLIELYLVETLGYTWDNVHEEAERLEHAVSEDLIERMSRQLGNPRFDPHGDPIPTVDGEILAIATQPLSEAPVGATVQITRVDSTSAERLRWLGDQGLIPGTSITVLEHHPFEGPVIVGVAGSRRVVGHALANQLRCTMAETA